MPRRALGFALTLTLAELARGYVLTGFPWAQIGHVWIGTPVAQLAALLGPTGLTLATALAAALPLAFRWRGLAASAALLAALTAFGVHRLSQPAPPDRDVVLRLAQPNAEQTLKWDPEMARVYFDRLLGFTAADGTPRPDLIIWPETAVPYLMERNPEVADIVARAARGATTILGVQREEGLRYFNSLVVLSPAGAITATYDKHHLVPFGEYIPAGDLAYATLGLAAFAAQQGYGYSPGPGPATLDLGPTLGRILPLICYEAVFPQDLLRAPGRADWILQITNDAWFGTLTGPFQHFAQARLRAIEQGLPLIRVANTGVSGVIDARGTVRATIPLGTAAFLDTPLPGALPPTLFARWGEVPALVLLVLLAAGLALIRPEGRA
jgi:apolipoprotein N-acyltransferase